MGGDVADIALRVPDHTRDVFEHAKFVVAENRQLDRVSRRRTVVSRPLNVDLPLRLVQEIRHVRAAHRMYRHALAARDVADDALAANWVATSRAIHQHISLPAHGDRVVISENSPHEAGETARL